MISYEVINHLRGDQLLASGDLAEPTKIRRSTGDSSKSSSSNKIERDVDHVLTTGRATQPARTGMSMPFSLLELRNQESPSRLQHSVHLRNGSLSIIIGDVVQGKGAGNRVERIVGERKLLRIADLEPRRDTMLARSRSGTVDHLRTGINAIDRPARGRPLGEGHGEPTRAAADIENMITGLELEIVSDHPAEAAAAPSQ